MNKFTPFLLAAASGCIEYSPVSPTEDVVVPNDRPLEVTSQSDKIVQVQQPEVDILWIVDNSCSMQEEQEALTANFPVFLDYFLGSGLDYHIGVVSTDMDNANESGRLISANGYRYIDEETVDPAGVFSGMALLGTGGSGDERGIDAGYEALEVRKDGYNTGFLREDSGVHVIVISDESDYSDNLTVGEMVGFMNGLRADPEIVSFSSVVSADPVCSGASSPGTSYLQVTGGVGGLSHEICTENWANVLEQLGLQASGLKREYFLSQVPVVETIEVLVIEAGVTYEFEVDTDWMYNQSRNSIIFAEYVPNPLTEIYVNYEVLSTLELE